MFRYGIGFSALLQFARLAQRFKQDATVEFVEAVWINLISRRMFIETVTGLCPETNALQGVKGVHCRLGVGRCHEALARHPAQS